MQKEPPVAADGSSDGSVSQGDYEAAEADLAKELGIDESYTVVEKSQWEIAKKTGSKNAHGTVVNIKKGEYQVWIDENLTETDYWTVRYHEIRHVWQKANGLTQFARYPSSYASASYISNHN